MIRCASCGQLPTQPVEGGTRIECRCGKTRLEFRQPVDIDAVKRIAFAALERARVRVHAVLLLNRPKLWTLSVENESRAEPGLPEPEARRYAAAINGEADLARAMLQLLAELEDLRAQANQEVARHGSGTMRRVVLEDEEFSREEAKTG
jgi:hypothetical protein